MITLYDSDSKRERVFPPESRFKLNTDHKGNFSLCFGLLSDEEVGRFVLDESFPVQEEHCFAAVDRLNSYLDSWLEKSKSCVCVIPFDFFGFIDWKQVFSDMNHELEIREFERDRMDNSRG